MPTVRPRSVGVSEGHHDLHAPDQVYVLQPSYRGALQQETESLNSVCLCTPVFVSRNFML